MDATKKRNHDAVTNEVEVAAMSRSERKRHREKKRRSDVNKGFDELTALLLEIDPEVRAEAEEKASKGQCKRSLGAHEDNVLSRVDLISTTIKVLRRIHQENEKHKRVIEDLAKGKGPAVLEAADMMQRPPAVACRTPESELSHLLRGGSSQGFGPGAVDVEAGSLLDRKTLLQNSVLGFGGPASWESAQLRAQTQAAMFPGLARHHLGGPSASDILGLRAAAGGRVPDSALLSASLSTPSALQRTFLQNMLQGPGNSRILTEAVYSALREGSAAEAEALLRRQNQAGIAHAKRDGCDAGHN
jgi:hypothetical protein